MLPGLLLENVHEVGVPFLPPGDRAKSAASAGAADAREQGISKRQKEDDLATTYYILSQVTGLPHLAGSSATEAGRRVEPKTS